MALALLSGPQTALGQESHPYSHIPTSTPTPGPSPTPLPESCPLIQGNPGLASDCAALIAVRNSLKGGLNWSPDLSLIHI